MHEKNDIREWQKAEAGGGICQCINVHGYMDLETMAELPKYE